MLRAKSKRALAARRRDTRQRAARDVYAYDEMPHAHLHEPARRHDAAP